MKPMYVALLWMIAASVFAQTQTQTIKGVVIDRDSKKPLIGAMVIIDNTIPEIKTSTDEKGQFRLTDVPLGRHTIQCVFWRYEGYATENVIVGAAKTLNLTIELSENAQKDNSDLMGGGQNRPVNDMLVASTRSFAVEETRRYPPSINDPSRMAMAFAGVRFKEDNDSDLLIRGNSAAGFSWRLEGIDIPNPNHFARRGSSGGGITIFSSSLLDRSDFSTGGFSAEYGNALSGVFDMHFRNGNNENREYTVRIGLVGLDFSTEGPFKKGGSSYLFNYRYSTLGLLGTAGIHLIAPNIQNDFQDLSFNISLPGKNRKSNVSIFGIGGLSDQTASPLPDTSEWNETTDYTLGIHNTDMGAIGIKHTWLLDDNSYLKTVTAFMIQEVIYRNDTLNPAWAATTVYSERFLEGRYSFSTYYNRKINSKVVLRSGLMFSHIFYNLRNFELDENGQQNDIIASQGGTQLVQPYIQTNFKFTNNLSMQVGVHAMYFSLNNTYAIDPRVSIRAELGKGHSLYGAYGIYSRTVPLGSYFVQAEDNSQPANLDLKMIHSQHAILGYEWFYKNDWHVKLEAYYQRLSNVPVGVAQDSTYWLLNDFVGYARDPLVSEGFGTNYGIDITFEKFFSKGYFVLLSGSVYRSFFTPLNGQTYTSRYDALFSSSYVAGKEFFLGRAKASALEISARATYAGGMRYTSGDLAASRAANKLVEDYSNPFDMRAPNYFRVDARVAFRKDHKRKRLSYTISLDIQNAFNIINLYNIKYNEVERTLVNATQAGILPVLNFQLDF